MVNRYRRAAGLGCMALVPQISQAAQMHCRYFVSNHGHCVASPHKQVPGCSHFAGEAFGDRLRAAGYTGRPAYEVMAYVGRGGRAVEQWIDSVWHRLPIFSSRVDHLGYGADVRCDTMDFGSSTVLPAPVAPTVYPYPGQADVPTAFGGRESPAPPRPPDGWPSGYPVTIYAAGLKIHEHSITVDGKDAPLPHIWLGPGDPGTWELLQHEYILYTHRPLAPRTRYRVRVLGTRADAPVKLEWTFTTR
jgi:hypothetical protein